MEILLCRPIRRERMLNGRWRTCRPYRYARHARQIFHADDDKIHTLCCCCCCSLRTARDNDSAITALGRRAGSWWIVAHPGRCDRASTGTLLSLVEMTWNGFLYPHLLPFSRSQLSFIPISKFKSYPHSRGIPTWLLSFPSDIHTHGAKQESVNGNGRQYRPTEKNSSVKWTSIVEKKL